jgi:hypothetical protein
MFFDFLSTIRRGGAPSGAAALIAPDGEGGEKQHHVGIVRLKMLKKKLNARDGFMPIDLLPQMRTTQTGTTSSSR